MNNIFQSGNQNNQNNQNQPNYDFQNNEKKNNININIKKDNSKFTENKKIIEDLKNKVGINMDYSSYTE